MRFLRVLLPIALLSLALLAPASVSAAETNFFGELYPPECKCETSAPEWGCVMLVLQNLINFGISLGVIIFVLVAAYAGILWMASPMNPQNREMGRSILINAVVGLLLALSAWLLVDFIMKVLYNPNASSGGGAAWGPWNRILAGNEDSYCLDQTSQTPLQPADGVPGADTGGSPVVGDQVTIGTRLECNWRNLGTYSPATVIATQSSNGEFLISVRYDDTIVEQNIPLSRCRTLGNENTGGEQTTGGSTCSNCAVVTGVERKAKGTGCDTGFGCNVNGGCDPETSPALNPPASDCMVNSSLLSKLQAASGSIGRVTEMWPPTTNHFNSCHGNGTCVDLTPRSTTDSGIVATARALLEQGLFPVWEANISDTECQRLLGVLSDAGITNIQIDTRNVNPHFSVYMSDVSNGCR